MRFSWHLLPLLLVAACAPVTPPPAPLAEVVVDESEAPAWHAIATATDRQRIDTLDRAWSQAEAQIGRNRFARALADEGPLLDSAAALPRPAPPPGPYVCRMLKLGTQARGPTFAAYRPFFCYVEAEDDLLTFVKQTGTQRPAGRFYADDGEKRLVFLGTMGRGNERQPPYGESEDSDMAGIVERVGPFRYRLVIPFPRYESVLDVIELVPFIENAPIP